MTWLADAAIYGVSSVLIVAALSAGAIQSYRMWRRGRSRPWPHGPARTPYQLGHASGVAGLPVDCEDWWGALTGAERKRAVEGAQAGAREANRERSGVMEDADGDD